jgi:hypothetical protein
MGGSCHIWYLSNLGCRSVRNPVACNIVLRDMFSASRGSGALPGVSSGLPGVPEVSAGGLECFPEVWSAFRRSRALSGVSSGFPGSREDILLYDVWFGGPGKCLGVG